MKRKSSPPPATIPGGQAREIIGQGLAAVVQLAAEPEDARRIEEAPQGGEGVGGAEIDPAQPLRVLEPFGQGVHHGAVEVGVRYAKFGLTCAACGCVQNLQAQGNLFLRDKHPSEA